MVWLNYSLGKEREPIFIHEYKRYKKLVANIWNNYIFIKLLKLINLLLVPLRHSPVIKDCWVKESLRFKPMPRPLFKKNHIWLFLLHVLDKMSYFLDLPSWYASFMLY